jgi:hypothetical protein
MYKKKISPQEALQDILLRMKYDSSKTLNENKLVFEQWDRNSEEFKIARSFWGSVSGMQTDEPGLEKAVASIKSADQFNKVNQQIAKFNGDQDFVEWINDDLERDDAKTVKFVIDHLKKIGVNATAEFNAGGKFIEGSFKITTTPIINQQNSKKQDGTKQPEKQDGTKQPEKKDGSKTNNKKTVQQKRSIPPELKNIENGVRKFQDWLDQNHKNWARDYKDGIINQGKNGGGYGTYGPRTQKMWLTKGVADEFLKFITKGSVTSKETPNVVTKQDSVVGGKENTVVGGKQNQNVVNTDNKPKSPQEIEDTY